MKLYNFVIYFIIPAFVLLYLFTSRFYFNRRHSQKMKYNMKEELLFTNIIVPIIGLILLLGIYVQIINIDFFMEIRWEIFSLFAISILVAFVGMGLGAHIVSLSIEQVVPKPFRLGKFRDTLDFFHFPFSHILAYIPTVLIFYLFILLDLFRGKVLPVSDFQVLILTLFGVIVGFLFALTMVVTHLTRLMFYALLVLCISIFIVLTLESITLLEHAIAYFMTCFFITCLTTLGIYRYVHLLSSRAHGFIQSKIKNGDLIKISNESEI